MLQQQMLLQTQTKIKQIARQNLETPQEVKMLQQQMLEQSQTKLKQIARRNLETPIQPTLLHL